MKTFDIETVRSWKPCYEPERHLKSGETYTALSILEREDIPFQDRLWVILRTELVSEKLMRLFAVWGARQVAGNAKDYGDMSTVLDVVEKYINGLATLEELQAAASAAASAAWSARSAAESAAASARAAALSAALSAAASAAWSARSAAWSARSAALSAAASAAESAAASARAAAESAQEIKLKEMLLEGVKTGDVK